MLHFAGVLSGVTLMTCMAGRWLILHGFMQASCQLMSICHKLRPLILKQPREGYGRCLYFLFLKYKLFNLFIVHFKHCRIFYMEG